MRKVLLSTSALALVGAVTTQTASANEWEMRVGGYMEQHVAYGSTDDDFGGDFDGVDIKSDSEIHFSPSITLDNGLQFSARVELEGATSGDQIDENYANIEGSFGMIRLGEDDVVAYGMAYAAPDVTFLNINSGSDVDWYAPGSGLTLTTSTYRAVASDPAGISYYSPRLAGFQVGATYARDSNRATDDSQVDLDTELGNIWSVAANYTNSFGDFGVAASAGYSAAEAPVGDDPNTWAAGLTVSYAGFSLGGSYADGEDNGSFFADSEVWDAGIAYETGPWGASFTYLHGEDDDGVSGVDEIDRYLLGASYTIAKGVVANAYGSYSEADLDTGDSLDGFIVGTAIKLTF